MTWDPNARVWSPEAQPERTALAWSRTALASAVLLCALVRHLLPIHPVVAAALAVVATPVLVAVAVAARARYRDSHRALRGGELLPDGRLAVWCALLVTLVALAAGFSVVEAGERGYAPGRQGEGAPRPSGLGAALSELTVQSCGTTATSLSGRVHTFQVSAEDE
ncbi:DUF202 domain-containing protein [Polymorphospora rubra]|uniref:DUF202 domain-containing protein n=1 Tax=Polymorphospora rubra TaxID=338584 RepID=UPI0033C6E645